MSRRASACAVDPDDLPSPGDVGLEPSLVPQEELTYDTEHCYDSITPPSAQHGSPALSRGATGLGSLADMGEVKVVTRESPGGTPRAETVPAFPLRTSGTAAPVTTVKGQKHKASRPQQQPQALFIGPKTAAKRRPHRGMGAGSTKSNTGSSASLAELLSERRMRMSRGASQQSLESQESPASAASGFSFEEVAQQHPLAGSHVAENNTVHETPIKITPHITHGLASAGADGTSLLPPTIPPPHAPPATYAPGARFAGEQVPPPSTLPPTPALPTAAPSTHSIANDDGFLGIPNQTSGTTSHDDCFTLANSAAMTPREREENLQQQPREQQPTDAAGTSLLGISKAFTSGEAQMQMQQQQANESMMRDAMKAAGVSYTAPSSVLRADRVKSPDAEEPLSPFVREDAASLYRCLTSPDSAGGLNRASMDAVAHMLNLNNPRERLSMSFSANASVALQQLASMKDPLAASVVMKQNRTALITELERRKERLRKQLAQLQKEATQYNIFALVRANNTSQLQYLLEKQLVNVDERDYNGCTALHVAASEGSLAIARVLVSFGADVLAVDHNGRTPLDCAALNRQSGVGRYLLQIIRSKQQLPREQSIIANMGEEALFPSLMSPGPRSPPFSPSHLPDTQPPSAVRSPAVVKPDWTSPFAAATSSYESGTSGAPVATGSFEGETGALAVQGSKAAVSGGSASMTSHLQSPSPPAHQQASSSAGSHGAGSSGAPPRPKKSPHKRAKAGASQDLLLSSSFAMTAAQRLNSLRDIGAGTLAEGRTELLKPEGAKRPPKPLLRKRVDAPPTLLTPLNETEEPQPPPQPQPQPAQAEGPEEEEENDDVHYSRYTTVSDTVPIVVCMCGLPGRGKSFISRRLVRYMNWKGVPCRVFNAGDYRRQLLGVEGTANAAFFDPNNPKGKELRERMAEMACEDLIRFIASLPLAVGILDATNTTTARRSKLKKFFEDQAREKNLNYRLLFIESVCTDETIITENILRSKCDNDDFKEVKDTSAVIAEFRDRIVQYEKVYETLEPHEGIPFIKIINVKHHVMVHQVPAGLGSRIVFFLMNLHPIAYPIYIALNGQTVGDVQGIYGGEERLTERGERYAHALKKFIQDRYVPHMVVLHATNLSTLSTLRPLREEDSASASDATPTTREPSHAPRVQDFAELQKVGTSRDRARLKLLAGGDTSYIPTDESESELSDLGAGGDEDEDDCVEEVLCPVPGLDNINYGRFTGQTPKWVAENYPRLSTLLFQQPSSPVSEDDGARVSPTTATVEELERLTVPLHFKKVQESLDVLSARPTPGTPLVNYCVQFPNGESYRQVNVRLEPALMAVMRTPNPVFVVAPHVPAEGILAFFADVVPEMSPTLRIPQDCVVEIGVKGDLTIHPLLPDAQVRKMATPVTSSPALDMGEIQEAIRRATVQMSPSQAPVQ